MSLTLALSLQWTLDLASNLSIGGNREIQGQR